MANAWEGRPAGWLLDAPNSETKAFVEPIILMWTDN